MKAVFEECPRGDSEEPSPVGVPSHYDVRAAVFADSEATSSSMVLEVKQVSGVVVFTLCVELVEDSRAFALSRSAGWWCSPFVWCWLRMYRPSESAGGAS